MWETVGSLERECIEEDCDDQEFHEVYDNMNVSSKLLLKYHKCKQVTFFNIGGRTSKYELESWVPTNSTLTLGHVKFSTCIETYMAKCDGLMCLNPKPKIML